MADRFALPAIDTPAPSNRFTPTASRIPQPRQIESEAISASEAAPIDRFSIPEAAAAPIETPTAAAPAISRVPVPRVQSPVTPAQPFDEFAPRVEAARAPGRGVNVHPVETEDAIASAQNAKFRETFPDITAPIPHEDLREFMDGEFGAGNWTRDDANELWKRTADEPPPKKKIGIAERFGRAGELLGSKTIDPALAFINKLNPLAAAGQRIVNTRAAKFSAIDKDGREIGREKIKGLNRLSLALNLMGGGRSRLDFNASDTEVNESMLGLASLIAPEFREQAEEALHSRSKRISGIVKGFEKERQERGETLLSKAVGGAVDMVPYMTAISMGVVPFVAVEGAVRFEELKNGSMELDDDGNVLMTKEGADLGEAVAKAYGGAALTFYIEKALGTAVGKGIGKGLGKITPKALKTVLSKLKLPPGKFPTLSKIVKQANTAGGLDNLFQEVVVEEGLEALANATLNLTSDFDSVGLQNVPEAAKDFAKAIPDITASMIVMRGGQYALSAPAQRQRKKRYTAIMDYRARRAAAAAGTEAQAEQIGPDFDPETFMEQESNKARTDIMEEFGVDPEEAEADAIQDPQLVRIEELMEEGVPLEEAIDESEAIRIEQAAEATQVEQDSADAQQDLQQQEAARTALLDIEPEVAAQAQEDRAAGAVITEATSIENDAIINAIVATGSTEGIIAPPQDFAEQPAQDFTLPPTTEQVTKQEPIATEQPVADTPVEGAPTRTDAPVEGEAIQPETEDDLEKFRDAVEPKSARDAERMWAKGDRLYWVSEMDDKPLRIRTHEELKNKLGAPDLLLALPPTQVEADLAAETHAANIQIAKDLKIRKAERMEPDTLATEIKAKQIKIDDTRRAKEAKALKKKSKARAKRAAKAEDTPQTLRQRIMEEFGGIKQGDGTPSALFGMHRKGAAQAFDQVAQDLFEAGALPDGNPTTLEKALDDERIASRKKPEPSQEEVDEGRELAAQEAEDTRQTANTASIKADEDTVDIDETELEEDSLVRKNGQWYQVADSPFGTTLEDGVDIEVTGGTKAAGVLFKGETGYDTAKAEYDAQEAAEAVTEPEVDRFAKAPEAEAKPKPRPRVPAPRKPKAQASELFESETTTREPVRGETKAKQVAQEDLLGGLAEATEAGKQERAQEKLDLEAKPTPKPSRVPAPRKPKAATGIKAVQETIAADGIKITLSETADQVSVSGIIVPEARRGQGVGTEAMGQVITYADANNKTIVLTPAEKGDPGGTTSRARLIGFYKGLGFVENKGKNKDFEINADAMYRTPSPAAADKPAAKPSRIPKPRKTAAQKKAVESAPADTFDTHNEVIGRLYNGDPVTVAEMKATYESVKADEGAIKERLTKLTVKKLLPMTNSFHARGETKPRIINLVYREMLDEYWLADTRSFTMGQEQETRENAINSMTQDDIDAKQDRVKKARAAREERISGIKKAIADPQTLDDFRQFIQFRKGGEDAMTDEQRTKYEALLSEKGMESRRQEKERKAKVDAVSSEEAKTVGMTLTEGEHSRTGAKLYIVNLGTRVETATFKELSKKAKQLGGRWGYNSRYGPSPDGFNFKTKENAEAFMALREGDVDRSEQVQAKQDKSKEKAGKSLRELADRMEERGDEKLNADRKTNTAKRAREAGFAEADARASIKTARTIRNIADAVDSGDQTILSGIRAGSHVEELERQLRRSRQNRIRKENISYSDSKEMPEAGSEDAGFAEYPTVELFKGDALRISTILKNKAGMKRLGTSIGKAAARLGEDGSITLPISDAANINAKIVGQERYTLGRIPDDVTSINRLHKMNITNVAELRTALREYSTFRGKAPKEDKLKKMLRDLTGNKGVGIDFHNTPTETASELADRLDISPGMRVLEPSAGVGHLADAIQNAEPDANLDTVEMSSTLREVLKEKGYTPEIGDFLDFTPDAPYDRILMNPPFSRKEGVGWQDIAHVRHAYDMLEPGGKLIAIVSSGTVSRSDKQSTEFKEWVEDLGSHESLDEGTFKDASVINQTGVNATVIEIEKPKDETTFGEIKGRSDEDTQRTDASTRALPEVAETIAGQHQRGKQIRAEVSTDTRIRRERRLNEWIESIDREDTFQLDLWENAEYSERLANTEEFKTIAEAFTRKGYESVPVTSIGDKGGMVDPDTKTVYLADGDTELMLGFAAHEATHVMARENDPSVGALIDAVDLSNASVKSIEDDLGYGSAKLQEEIAAAIVSGRTDFISTLKDGTDVVIAIQAQDAVISVFTGDDANLKGAVKKQRISKIESFFDAVADDIAARKRAERPAETFARVPASRTVQEQVNAARRETRAVGIAQTLERAQAKTTAEKVKGKTQERTAKARKKAASKSREKIKAAKAEGRQKAKDVATKTRAGKKDLHQKLIEAQNIIRTELKDFPDQQKKLIPKFRALAESSQKKPKTGDFETMAERELEALSARVSDIKRTSEHKAAEKRLKKVVDQIRRKGLGKFGAARKAGVKAVVGDLAFKRLADDKAVLDAWVELQGDDTSDLSEQQMREMNKLITKLVKNMDIDEINYITWVLSRALEEQKQARKTRHANRTDKAMDDRDEIIDTIGNTFGTDSTGQVNKAPLNIRQAYRNLFLPSDTVANILDGGVDGGPVQRVFVKSFYDGTKRNYEVRKTVAEELEGKLGTVDELSMKRPTEYTKIPKRFQGPTASYTLDSGKKLDLYQGEQIALYLHSLNDDNVRHITDSRGGIVLPDDADAARSIKLTENDLKQVVDDVEADPEMKKIADAYHNIFNSTLKGFLNKTSEQLHAEEVADVDNYMPIVVSRLHRFFQSLDNSDIHPADMESIARMTLESMGALKRRMPSSKAPIMLYDVFTAAERSTKVAGLYYGYALPVDMMKRTMSPRFEKGEGATGTVESAVTRALGKTAWTSIRSIGERFEKGENMTDIEHRANSFLNTMTKGALAWNAPVWLIQPISFATAKPFIPAKYFIKAAASKPATYEEMGEHSPMLWARGRGRVSIATGEVLTGRIGSLGEAGMKGILWGDRQAVGRIWNAVKMQVTENNPKATEKKIAEMTASKVEWILWRTQPTFEAETRSQIQRNKDLLSRMLMRFSSQRTTLYDMNFRSTQDFKSGKAGVAKTLETKAVLLASAVLVAGLKTVAAGIYKRRPEDEPAWKDFLQTLLSTISSLGGRGPEVILDVINGALNTGYGMSDPLVDALNNVGFVVVNTGKGALQLVRGDVYASGERAGELKGKRTLAYVAKRAARLAGVTTGTGVHNIIEPALAILKHGYKFFDPEGKAPPSRTPSRIPTARRAPTRRQTRSRVPRPRRAPPPRSRRVPTPRRN